MGIVVRARGVWSMVCRFDGKRGAENRFAWWEIPLSAAALKEGGEAQNGGWV